MAAQNQTISFTRPADTTQYAIGDLIANSATAGSVVAPIYGYGSGTATRLIRQARIRKSGTSLTGASFRLWLFSAAPTVTNGDNGALTGNFSATVVGVYEGEAQVASADGAVGWLLPAHEPIYYDGPMYALLEARGAYTPVSEEVFAITLEQADV